MPASSTTERLLTARADAPHRAPRSQDSAFAALCDELHHVFTDANLHRAAHAAGGGGLAIDVDDLRQEALIRVLKQFNEYPTDAGQREAWARRSLRVAAMDAVRAVGGRKIVDPRARKAPQASNRDEVLYAHNVSLNGHYANLAFSADAPLKARGQAVEQLARSIRERIAIEDERYEARLLAETLTGLVAVLHDREQHALLRSAAGHSAADIAADLDVSPATVNVILHTAKWLVRTALEHADGPNRIPKDHWAALERYLDTPRRGSRAENNMKRHLKMCAACNAYAQRYNRAEQQYAAFFVLPAVIGTGAHLTSSAAASHASNGFASSTHGASWAASSKTAGSIATQAFDLLPGGKLALLASVAVIATGAAAAGTLAGSQYQPGNAAAATNLRSAAPLPRRAPPTHATTPSGAHHVPVATHRPTRKHHTAARPHTRHSTAHLATVVSSTHTAVAHPASSQPTNTAAPVSNASNAASGGSAGSGSSSPPPGGGLTPGG
jgi:RNA polymerase sigma factor (sigma-70 family)